MSKDTLSEFGRDAQSHQQPRASGGGQMTPKPIPYSPPNGPSNINDAKSPGLHGTNHGNCGTQR